MARFSQPKGHEYFIEAASMVVKYYKNVEFIFVGDGPLRQIAEEKVKKLNIESYCHFLGNRSDVGKILQTFDIFILSSLWEGLPLSLLEAQYFGIASIVTNVGGIPEVVKNEYNGLLVPPKDPVKLSQTILRVLNDYNLRKELGKNGKKVVMQRFTIDKMKNCYLNLIYSIFTQNIKKKRK